jgi:uncharacterized protein
MIKLMTKKLPLLLIFALLLTGCGKTTVETKAAGPLKLDSQAAESVTKAIEKDREETREWLRNSPMSYLAAVDRIDFGPKQALTVGKAGDNDVRLNSGQIKAHHLRVAVDGDQFHIQAMDENAGFKIQGETKRDATSGPTSIQVGPYTLRLSHQRYPAIVVFDPESPRLNEYKGLSYFPIDLSYRYEIHLTPTPKPEKIVIMSTRGNQRQAERLGWFDFFVGNTACRLEAARLLEPGAGESEVSIFFRDATSGNETYSLGRYVDAKKLDTGNYLLDFNMAYNPACAFSNYYNCPIPPKANTLAVPIRAGERDSHYH